MLREGTLDTVQSRALVGLSVVVALLIVVLHIAHLTGLRNTLAVILAVWTFTTFVRARELPPLAVPALGWLAIGLTSASWSPSIETTLKSVVYDIVFPFGAFYAAYLACRRESAFALLAGAIDVGILSLLSITLLAHLTGQPEELWSHFPTGVAYYFPGPGASSTLAVYAAPFMLARAYRGTGWARGRATLGLAGIAIVGMGTQNRMFWIALIGAVAVFSLWGWKRFSSRQCWLIAATLTVAAAMALMTVFYLTAKRNTYAVAEDIRYEAWREWGTIAAEAPLLGYGLGKKVLEGRVAPRLPGALLTRDERLASHAHNLPLNIILQVGILGLLSFAALIASVLRLAWRARDPGHLPTNTALVALVVVMLVKNTTDDVMDHAVIVAFWTYAGMLAGRLAAADRG